MARRTKKDALLTRAALLDAAELLFEQNGVSRTSLADIARAAGVTRGAIYWHFKDKADLFDAMLQRVTLPLEVDLARLLAHPGNLLEAWRTHLRGALQQIEHNAQTRRVLRIAMQKVEHAQEMGPAVARHIDLYHINVEQGSQILAQAASRRGLTLPAPPLELARAVHALLHGLIYAWLLDPDFDLAQSTMAALDLFFAGAGLGQPATPQKPAPAANPS